MKNVWLSLAANKRIPEVVSCGIANNCVTTWFKSGSNSEFHERIINHSYLILHAGSETLTSSELQVSNLISYIVLSSMPNKIKDLKYYLDRYDGYILRNNVKSEVENVAIKALDKHFGLEYKRQNFIQLF